MSIYIYACVTTQDWGSLAGCSARSLGTRSLAPAAPRTLCTSCTRPTTTSRGCVATSLGTCSRGASRIGLSAARARAGARAARGACPHVLDLATLRVARRGARRAQGQDAAQPRVVALLAGLGLRRARRCWATTRARGRQSWRTCARRACICTTCNAAIDVRLLRQEADAAHAHAHARLPNTSSLHGTARDSRPRARLHRRAPGLPARAHLAHSAAGTI